MGLEYCKDSSEIRSFRGSERCSNFGWVVSVIIDDSDAVLRLDLKSPVDSLKAFKRGGDDARLNAHVAGRCKCGSRIQHIVDTGNMEPKPL